MPRPNKIPRGYKIAIGPAGLLVQIEGVHQPIIGNVPVAGNTRLRFQRFGAFARQTFKQRHLNLPFRDTGGDMWVHVGRLVTVTDMQNLLFIADIHWRALAVTAGAEQPDGPESQYHVNPGEAKTARTIQDRKSTRLNSSHVAISYAVFCLKKKKK